MGDGKAGIVNEKPECEGVNNSTPPIVPPSVRLKKFLENYENFRILSLVLGILFTVVTYNISLNVLGIDIAKGVMKIFSSVSLYVCFAAVFIHVFLRKKYLKNDVNNQFAMAYAAMKTGQILESEISKKTGRLPIVAWLFVSIDLILSFDGAVVIVSRVVLSTIK